MSSLTRRPAIVWPVLHDDADGTIDRHHLRGRIEQRALDRGRRARGADVAEIGGDARPSPSTRWQLLQAPLPSKIACPRAALPTLTAVAGRIEAGADEGDDAR